MTHIGMTSIMMNITMKAIGKITTYTYIFELTSRSKTPKTEIRSFHTLIDV